MASKPTPIDITNDIRTLQQEADINKTKYEYQSQSFASLYIINDKLRFVYYGLLIIFAAFILWSKYLSSFFIKPLNGTALSIASSRNVYKDIGALIGFATLPLWAIYLEELIYRIFSYLSSLIFGKIYVNNFYKMFNTTNFYYEPK